MILRRVNERSPRGASTEPVWRKASLCGSPPNGKIGIAIYAQLSRNLLGLAHSLLFKVFSSNFLCLESVISRNNTSKFVNEAGLSRRQMLGMSGAALGSALLSGLMPPVTMRPVAAAAVPVNQTKKADQTGAVGFVLSHEQFPVNQLVELGQTADAAGFDSYWTSDHFHPWQDDEAHAGQAWVTLAALGQLTKVAFGTGVTCPTFRYRPAIVAEAFASLGLLYPGRVFLGVETGEALNEVPGGGRLGEVSRTRGASDRSRYDHQEVVGGRLGHF